MKITFRNYSGEGPLIDFSDRTALARGNRGMAACNAHSSIAMMAMFALGKRSATAESVRAALLAAVDELREQIASAAIEDEKE